MAFVGIKVLTTREGSRREKWDRRYTMRYLVETDSPYDGANTVLSFAQVPQIGSYYVTYGAGETDMGARCVDVVASHVDGDPKLWYVDATFESAQREDPEDQEAQTPNERKPTIGIRFERHQVPVFEDLGKGRGVCNSKDQPFSPPVMRDQTRLVVTLTRYETALNLSYLMTLQDKVNSDTFANAQPYTLKLNVSDVHEEFIEGQRYWVKTYELAYDPDTWNPDVLDKGYIQDPETGNFREVLLDGNGAATDRDNPSFIEVKRYDSLIFGKVAAIAELDQGEGAF